MSILNIEDIDEQVHNTIYSAIDAHEYEKTARFVREQLRRLEGRDDEFTVWFERHEVSLDGYEWNMSQNIGYRCSLEKLFDLSWHSGSIWCEADFETCMSAITAFLQTEYNEYMANWRHTEDDRNIKLRFDETQKFTKAKAGITFGMFTPIWHYSPDWWGPHET